MCINFENGKIYQSYHFQCTLVYRYMSFQYFSDKKNQKTKKKTAIFYFNGIVEAFAVKNV